MRVILTDDVVGVGDIGEIVRVKAGYARNFLIPRGLAMEVGTASGRAIEHKTRQLEAKKKRMKDSAQAQAERLSELKVELELRVGSGGKVFGSVHGRDIVEKLKGLGYEIDRRRVLLHEPIRKLGIHNVRVKLHAQVVSELKVEVKGIAATDEQEMIETEAAKMAVELAASKRKHSEEMIEEESEQ